MPTAGSTETRMIVVGLLGRDLFDLHAAGSRGNDHDALGGAVHDERQIDLLGDVDRFLDVEARHELAGGTGLVRRQLLAEHGFRGALDLVVGRADLDAAGLAAGARMDLRLDDPLAAADLGGAIGGLLGAVGEAAAGNRHAELRKKLFGLVLVNIHCSCFPRID